MFSSVLGSTFSKWHYTRSWQARGLPDGKQIALAKSEFLLRRFKPVRKSGMEKEEVDKDL